MSPQLGDVRIPIVPARGPAATGAVAIARAAAEADADSRGGAAATAGSGSRAVVVAESAAAGAATGAPTETAGTLASSFLLQPRSAAASRAVSSMDLLIDCSLHQKRRTMKPIRHLPAAARFDARTRR